MKRYFLLPLILIYALSASPQMSLNDCLLYARDNALQNKINVHIVARAKADQLMAASGLMPSLSLSSNGSLSFGRNIDPETNTYDNKKTLATSYGLSLSVPLFDGLVSLNNLKAAKVARLRQESAAKVEQDRISFSVIRDFFNVSYLKAMVVQMDSQLQRDSTLLAACIHGEALGLKSGADVAELEAIVAADRCELLNQQNLLTKAFLQLRADMGMPLEDSPLELYEETDHYPVALSALSGPSATYIGNPREIEAELDVKENHLYLRNAWGDFMPHIYLNGGISSSYFKMIGKESYYAPSFSRQFKDNLGEYVGFSFSIPIFDGFAGIGRIRRAKASLLESRSRLDQVRYELEKETLEASLDLKAANEEFFAAETRLKAENMAYEAVARKFELGASSAVDLFTSGSKLAEARASLEGKRIRRIICRITLSYYMGFPLINENN